MFGAFQLIVTPENRYALDLANSYIFSGLKNWSLPNIVRSGENVIFVPDLIFFSPTLLSLSSGIPLEKL